MDNLDHHHNSKASDCQSSKELLPSQMSLEQFDDMLNHMSRKQIRHALREMAKCHPSDDCLVKTELCDSQAACSDKQRNNLLPAPGADRPPSPPPPPGPESPPPAAEPRFYGLNLGIIKLGVTDDGSLNAGVNIGIARVDTKFGLQNRVDAQAGVGDFNAHTGAGVGLGRNGVNADVYAGAKVFDLTHVDAGFGAAVGPRTGVDGKLSANVGPGRFNLDTDHEVGVNGLYSGVDASVGVPHAVDFHTKAHVGVNRNSSAGADVGLDLAHSSISTGAGIETRANTVLAPDVHLDTRNRDNYYRSSLGAQLGPGLDLNAGGTYSQDYFNGYRRHFNASTISTGIGQHGIGVRETTRIEGDKYRDWAAGIGPDYE